MKITNVASLLALLGTQTYALVIPRTDSTGLTNKPADSSGEFPYGETELGPDRLQNPVYPPGEFPYGGWHLPFENQLAQTASIPALFDNRFSHWWFGLQSKDVYDKHFRSAEQAVDKFMNRVAAFPPMEGMFHPGEYNHLLLRVPHDPTLYGDPYPIIFNNTMQALREQLPAGVNATNQALPPAEKALFDITLVNDSMPFDPTTELKVRFLLNASNDSTVPYELIKAKEARVAHFLIARPDGPLPFTGQDVMNELSKLFFYKPPDGKDLSDLFTFNNSPEERILKAILYNSNDTTTGSSLIHTLAEYRNDSGLPFFNKTGDGPVIADVNPDAFIQNAINAIYDSKRELTGWGGLELAKAGMIIDPQNAGLYRDAIGNPLKQRVRQRLEQALREMDRATLQLRVHEANSQFWGRAMAEAFPAVGMLLASAFPFMRSKKWRANLLVYLTKLAGLSLSPFLFRETQSTAASITFASLSAASPLFAVLSADLASDPDLFHLFLYQRSFPTFLKELVGIQNAVGMAYYLAHRPSIAGHNFAAAYAAKLLTQYAVDLFVALVDRIASRYHRNDHQIQQTFREYDMGYRGGVISEREWDLRLASQIKKVSNIAHLRWWANVPEPIRNPDFLRDEHRMQQTAIEYEMEYPRGRGAAMFADSESSQKAYEASHGYMSSGELVKWKSQSHIETVLSNMMKLQLLKSGANPTQSTHVQDYLNREVGNKEFGLNKPSSEYDSQGLVTTADVRRIITVIQHLRKESPSAPTAEKQAKHLLVIFWNSRGTSIFTEDGWSIISNNHPLLSARGREELRKIRTGDNKQWIKTLNEEVKKFTDLSSDSDFLSEEGNALLRKLWDQQQTPKDKRQLTSSLRKEITREILDANARPALTDLARLIASNRDEEPDLSTSMLSRDCLELARKAQSELAELPEDLADVLMETTLSVVIKCEELRRPILKALDELRATPENDRTQTDKQEIKELVAQLEEIPEHPVKNFSWPTKAEHLLADGVLRQFFMYEKFPHLFEQERLEITRLEDARKSLQDEEKGTDKFDQKTTLPLPPAGPAHPKMPELSDAWKQRTEKNDEAIAKKVAQLVLFYETMDASVMAELKKQNPESPYQSYQWLPLDKLVGKKFDITTLDPRLVEDLEARVCEVLRTEGIKTIYLEGIELLPPTVVYESPEGIELPVIQPNQETARKIWKTAYKNNLLLSGYSPTPKDLESVSGELFESLKGMDTGAILKHYPGIYVAPAPPEDRPLAGNRLVVKVDDDGNAVVMSVTEEGIQFLVTAAKQPGIDLKAGEKTPDGFRARAAIVLKVAKQPTDETQNSALEKTDGEKTPITDRQSVGWSEEDRKAVYSRYQNNYAVVTRREGDYVPQCKFYQSMPNGDIIVMLVVQQTRDAKFMKLTAREIGHHALGLKQGDLIRSFTPVLPDVAQTNHRGQGGIGQRHSLKSRSVVPKK